MRKLPMVAPAPTRRRAWRAPIATRELQRRRSAWAGSWTCSAASAVAWKRSVRAPEASAADLQALQVAIVGEVARSYVELRGLQERLRVARENAENQQRNPAPGRSALQRRARHRVRYLACAARSWKTTLARVPALEAQVAVTMHRVAVLTGRTPDALIAELEPQQPLPALPGRLDPGTPGDLLRQRPDVAAAEQRLHAATARIGVATADLFPRFTLGGLIGTPGHRQQRVVRTQQRNAIGGAGHRLVVPRHRPRACAHQGRRRGCRRRSGALRAGRAAGTRRHRKRVGAPRAFPRRGPAPGARRARQREGRPIGASPL